MKDIIKQLFHAFEDTSPLNTEEERTKNKAENKLVKMLGKKEKKLFSKYQDELTTVDDQYAERNFRQGFCLGCKLMTAVHKNINL